MGSCSEGLETKKFLGIVPELIQYDIAIKGRGQSSTFT